MKIQIFLICFLFSGILARAQNFEWVKTFSGSGVEEPFKSAIGEDRSIYLAGRYSSSIDFDPGLGTFTPSTGTTRACIVKLDSTGSFVWFKEFYSTGALNTSVITDVLIDSTNNIVVTGFFNGTVDFDPSTSVLNKTSTSSYRDMFIAKLDASGNLIWVNTIGSSTSLNCYPFAIDKDKENNLIIVGEYDHVIDFDPGLGVYSMGIAGPSQMFVIKLASDGSFIWARSINTTNGVSARDIAVDLASNVYIVGQFSGSGDFDTDSGVYSLTSTSFSSLDGFIIKLNKNGAYKWSGAIGNTNTDQYNIVSIDNEQNIITGGVFELSVDFDITSSSYILSTPSSTYGGFIQKLDSLGNFIWAGTFDRVRIKDIQIDEVNFVYILGEFHVGTTDFDPGLGIYNMTSIGDWDFFVEKLTPESNFVWAAGSGSAQQETACNLQLLEEGGLILTGGFYNSVDFDLDTSSVFTSSSTWASDNFLLKLQQDFCSSLALNIDSISNVTCATNGFAFASSDFGFPDYVYYWNGLASTSDSISEYYVPGIYNVLVVDSLGCWRTIEFLVNGIDSTILNIFNLQCNLHTQRFVPGLTNKIFLDSYNHGCDTISGNLTLILDSIVSYVSAVPAPDSISGDTLIWNFTALNYDSTHLTPVVTVITDTTATIGDTVCFTVIANPIAGDADTTNNIKTYCYPVVNSYDPNDKQVYPQGECPQHFVVNNQKLTYTVRFQNTGTAEAINIYILDSLDVNLNLNSVRLVGNSHYVITEVLPGNVLKFRFDNIHLADSTSDEANSHGYVIFEVDPLPALPNGTIIENTSHIYFDFNPPITTNTVFNTLIDVIPSCFLSVSHAEEVKEKLMVYPNPANQTITILTQEKPNQVIVISDVYGRIVKQITSHTSTTTINVQEWPNGVYILSVNGKTAKLVKN